MAKLNTNSNVYTIGYAIVMVVIVAFLLAFISSSLKEKQDKNVELDYKKQILNSLDLRDLPDADAEKTYSEVVKSKDMIKLGTKMVNGKVTPDTIFAYTCEVKGETKYVLPVKGAGLWGPISGFIAVNADKNTVYGAYFNHEGETAGLGAKIKDDVKWQKKFKDMKIFNGDDIALGVQKKVEKPESEVDAVTGATLTSNGVDEMLKKGLADYKEFLKK